MSATVALSWRLAPLCMVLLAGCSQPEPQLRLQQDELPTCEQPVEQPGALTDSTTDSAVDFVHSPAGLDIELSRLDGHVEELSAGVVAADLDNDDWIDLFLPQLGGANGLYWGGPGTSYTSAGTDHIAALADEFSQGGSVADFDGDGLLDLLIVGRESLALLRNQGERRFEDVTEQMGLEPEPGTSASSAWADFDGDGDLDLFVGNYGEAAEPGPESNGWNSLWRNDGDHFTDIGESLRGTMERPGQTIHASWRDFDYDGDPDLLVLNDRGAVLESSVLLENQGDDELPGGRWLERLRDALAGPLLQPMGASIIDLDGDGLRDLWVSNIGRTQAYLGQGNWQFLDVSLSWTEDLSSWQHAVSWAVVDLDLAGHGDPGVLLTYGPLSHSLEAEEQQEWLNQGDRYLRQQRDEDGTVRFVATDDVFPVDTTGNSRGVARADLNRDGVPDVVIGRIEASPLVLLGRCTDAQRLVVNLRDPNSRNRFAIGALVTVTAGGRSQVREVSADGPGPFSGSDPALLFGLGDASQVDALTIRWPNGDSETFTQLCAHCRITVHAPAP